MSLYGDTIHDHSEESEEYYTNVDIPRNYFLDGVTHNTSEKGSRHNRVDIQGFKSKLLELKPYIKSKIRDLPHDALQSFDSIKTVIGLLYDKPAYHEFYKLVQETFDCNHQKTEDLEPGTILNYFCGCVNSSKNSCSVYCASAMPQPISDGGSTCQDNVISVYSDGSDLKFDYLNRSKHSRRAMIYLKYSNLENFPGFSHNEIQQLRLKDIDEVKLLPFPRGSSSSGPATPFMPLDKLPIRSNKIEEGFVDSIGLTAIACILFILLILGIAYLLIRRS